MAKLSRRQLAFLSSSLLAGGVAPSPAATLSPAATPAQATPGTGSAPADLLSQRQASLVRSREELQNFELAYSDEPLFRLVVR